MSEPNVSEPQTARAAFKPPVWLWAVSAALLVIGVFALVSAAHGKSPATAPVAAAAAGKADEPDLEPPVILGVSDIFVTQGDSVSYRSGVTAEDAVDGAVTLQVDAGGVNLNVPGEYTVTYSAQDKSGNTATASARLTVLPSLSADVGDEITPDEDAADETSAASQGTQSAAAAPLPKVPENLTQEDVEALADKILAKIVTPGMSKRDAALAIFRYVAGNIKYVGSSDKSSWVIGAYVGFTQKRGDCFNYYACSKVLLTRAGIPNVDVHRVGGTSRHYWQLVDVGDGYYHFDACPHPLGYSLVAFLLTERQVREYTALVSGVRLNYYVYDYDACPVTVVDTPTGEVFPSAPPAETGPAPAEEPPAEDVEGAGPAPEDAVPPEGEGENAEPADGEAAEPSAGQEPQDGEGGDTQAENGEQPSGGEPEPEPTPEPEPEPEGGDGADGEAETTP